MTTFCEPDNSTMSPPRSRWFALGGDIDSSGASAEDREETGQEYVTKEQLLRFAQARIVQSMSLPRNWDDNGGLPASSDAAKLALAMCGNLLFADNLATPQISPDGMGGIDIEWLVSGRHLSLSVSRDGALVMWGTRPDGTEVFSFDAIEDGVEREVVFLAIKHARAFLNEMSADVSNRLQIR